MILFYKSSSKGHFSLELTRVRLQCPKAKPEYKAEIKFHGRLRPADERDAKYYTGSMLLKVSDILRRIICPNLTHILPEDILYHILGSMPHARDVELAPRRLGGWEQVDEAAAIGRAVELESRAAIRSHKPHHAVLDSRLAAVASVVGSGGGAGQGHDHLAHSHRAARQPPRLL